MAKKINPRWKSGRRRKFQERYRALQLNCAICGREIDYTLPPSDPYSFVIDEIIPVSKWQQAGYASPSACADDFRNTQPAHRLCNARKGNKLNYKIAEHEQKKEQRKPVWVSAKW